jgi:hypothetical protein
MRHRQRIAEDRQTALDQRLHQPLPCLAVVAESGNRAAIDRCSRVAP